MAAACDTEGKFSDHSFVTIFEVSVDLFVLSFYSVNMLIINLLVTDTKELQRSNSNCSLN